MSGHNLDNHNTDFPAYSDTGYIDTPVTVTVLTVPNWPFIYKQDGKPIKWTCGRDMAKYVLP